MNVGCIYLLVLAGWTTCVARAQVTEREYFRVRGPSDSTISSFGRAGVLDWISDTNEGGYLVERAEGNPDGPWTPWTKGQFRRPGATIKVQELSKPEGMVFIPGGRFEMGDSQNNGSLPFTESELVDQPALAAALKTPSRAVDVWIAAQLDRGTVDGFAEYPGTGLFSAELQTSLVRDLNRLREGPSIYDVARFQRVVLRQETSHLLSVDPEGPSLARLNRLLIEDAYPGVLARTQSDPLVNSLASPVHTVQVSPFFMDRFEFTNRRMQQLLQWAYERDLIKVEANSIVLKDGPTNVLGLLGKFNSEIIFSNGVFSIRAGRDLFPAQYVSWFGAAALCNFESLRQGLPTCYNFGDWSCDFKVVGYRIPTEAEWEFAARGGYEGRRFPWPHTNVITHALANYRSDTNNLYDVSPTREYHPDFTNLRPRSSPVGYFAPNNFGLYDMAGNNWEWVWDFHARFPAAFAVDPTGPTSGANRLFKGGSWFTKAERLTCAMRYPSPPNTVFDDIGFRMVLPVR